MIFQIFHSENLWKLLIDKMIFWKGRPNLDDIGYLYILDGREFIYTRGTQWVCRGNVIPLEIIKINVNDYLLLMRYATEEVKKIFEIKKMNLK